MIWLDLTDLFEWKGHFTGIQRVTYNYAAKYNAQGAQFFVYSNLYKRFIEVPFDLFEQFNQEKEEQIKKRQIVKGRLKLIYKRVPLFIRFFMAPVVGQLNQLFRKLAAMLLDHQERDHIIRKFPSAHFQDGDTVLLLGAGWNSGKLIDRVGVEKSKVNFKLLVHLNDILPIYQPQLFAEELPKKFNEYVQKALRIADTVSVISEATKKDVLRLCEEEKIQLPRVAVVRLGENLTTTKPVKPEVTLSDKFILAVGTFEVRKNYQLLYQAVKLAISEDKEIPQLVIAGRQGWLAHDLRYTIKHDPAVSSKIVLLEKMSDANLSWLYDHCQFTIFSSLAEGWGLPIAESLQHGKFCLSSNGSSMPEIAGNKIDYFNPYDTRECTEKILKYAAKNNRELNSHIKENYEPFTWDHSFEVLKELTESIA